jgi:hypothetical protein
MKILAEKYPLIDFSTRHQAMNEQLFRDVLMTKIAMSKFKEDATLFNKYREFVDDIANTQEIKTYLIAKTVSDYLFEHQEKIMTKLWNFIPDMKDSTGAILWGDWTYFYRKFNQEDEAIIMYMSVMGDTAELGAVIKDRDDITHVRGTPPEKSTAAAVGFTMSTLVLPFLEFAECETKIVNVKTAQRVKLNKEKYITDIPSNIEIVDSSWFTTLIRTDAFGVSGHFRLQPVGMGRSERKLIWIKDFQKQGYTKRAKVEIKRTEE